MKRKSLSELKELVLKDMEKQNHYIEVFEGDNNPQTKELYNNSKTRLEAMEAVLEYINNGSRLFFEE